MAIAWASASPECTKPLSTTGRSLTLRSSARYTQPSPPCAMQPLITYWPATMSPGLSCGRKEYGLPQYGHQPSDSALPSLLDRPTGRPQFQQNRLDSGTTGLGINASSGSMSGTRGISTSPPPSRRTGARVAGFTRSCGSVSAVRNGVSSLSSSSKSGRKIAWVATGRLCADESTIASAAWVPGPASLSCKPSSASWLSESTGCSAISPHTSGSAGPARDRAPLTTCGTRCSRCRRGGCVPGCR